MNRRFFVLLFVFVLLAFGLMCWGGVGRVFAEDGEMGPKVTATPEGEEGALVLTEEDAAHVALVEDFVADLFGEGFFVERVGDEFVRVTVPADAEDEIEYETGMDFDASEVVLIEEHADGSSTVTFTAEYYDGELAEMVTQAEFEMKSLMAEGVFASLQGYEYAEGMDVFDVQVNGAAFLAGATYDAYSALIFGYFGVSYQVLDGIDFVDVSTNVNFFDAVSGELVAGYVFPEQFEEFDFSFLDY